MLRIRTAAKLFVAALFFSVFTGVSLPISHASGPPYEPGDPACLTFVDTGDFNETRTLTNGFFCNGSIVIPVGVTVIGSSSFNGATGLTSISIPVGVIEIESTAFLNATSLESVVIPNSVTRIGDSAFEGTSLRSLNIPNSITSIGSSAFQGLDNLTTLNIPRSLESLGNFAFRDTTLLNSVTFQDESSLEAIPTGLFYDSKSLESITIVSGVSSIGDYAFFGAESLTAVRFLGTPPLLGTQAFLGVNPQAKALVNRSQFESFTAESQSNPNWSDLEIEIYYFPSEDLSCLTESGSSVVSGVDCVGSITIPNNISSIGDNAFLRAESLTSITLPSGVTAIGASAFESATSLSLLRFMGSAPSLGANSLLNIAGGAIARVNQLHQASYVVDVDGLWNGLTLEIMVPPASNPAASENAAFMRELERQREEEKRTARVNLVSFAKESAPLKLELFNQAAIPGVTSKNVSEVSAEILDLPLERRSQLDEILKVVRKFEVVDKVASNQRFYSTMLQEVGLIAQGSKHKAALTSAIRKLPLSERTSYMSIKLAVDAQMAEIQSRKDRLAAIMARIASRNAG